MKGIYHVKPLYESFIWGGRKMIEEFNLDYSLDKIGTIYSVIAIPGHLDNLIEETQEPLSEFYHTHSEVFGCAKKEFPIRMSITCNEGFQSYQLHPDDEYAKKHENKMGKVSGSVTLKESNHVSKKLFGHKAKSLEEFKKLVERKDWENLFSTVDVRDGDFLHTPAGVIHGGYGDGKIYAALGTNGDITYRFYDLDRNEPDRPLHFKEVFDCVNIPEIDLSGVVIRAVSEMKNNIEVLNYYEKANEYVAKQLKVNGKGTFSLDEFYFITNVSGEGFINGEILKKGDTLLIEKNHGDIQMDGKMDLMLLSYFE